MKHFGIHFGFLFLIILKVLLQLCLFHPARRMKKQPDSRHLFLRRQKTMATNTLLFYTSRGGDVYYFHSVLRDSLEIWFGVQRAVLIHLSPELPRVNETPYFQNRIRTASILRCAYAKICFAGKVVFVFYFRF